MLQFHFILGSILILYANYVNKYQTKENQN